MGCAPYLQIFKAGQLVFTTAASLHYNQDKDDLPFCQVADGAISFHIENVVQGDILIRCRHLTSQGQRVSMFRAAFHTGYVPPNVMRLTKAQLDGACDDKRFPDDFFLDLIFEACDAEMASKHLSGKADATGSEDNHDNDSQNEAFERREKGTLAGADATQPQVSTSSDTQGPTVTASAYDSMLHRDSRFWDVIASRRQQHAQIETESPGGDDPFWGSTIGRRRKFESESKNDDESGGESGTASETVESPSSLPTFSIGGELDFLQSKHSGDDDKVELLATNKEEEPKERDELMEALMAIDDETLSPIADKKTRVFNSTEAPPESAARNEILDEKAKEEKTQSSQEDNKIQDNKELPNQSKEKLLEGTQSTNAVDVAADLLDADLDLDEDVDAFLAAAGAGDIDIDDTLDFEDDDLDDLENFLTSK